MIDSNTLSNLRKNYSLNELDETSVDASPFKQFNRWFEEALSSELPEPNAMTLATANQSGEPSARIVLLKSFDESGFIFFTNYESRKGKEIFENPKAALLFFWVELERQIRIEGKIEKISRIDSFDYFRSRPHDSQIGAWCSPQSSVIPDRNFLEDRFVKLSVEFSAGNVPLPNNWGGYKVIPDTFEFWQGRASRLHDRIFYSLDNGKWEISRLAP